VAAALCEVKCNALPEKRGCSMPGETPAWRVAPYTRIVFPSAAALLLAASRLTPATKTRWFTFAVGVSGKALRSCAWTVLSLIC